MFSEFINEIVKELEAKENRERSRGVDAQFSFKYAVRYILETLWRDNFDTSQRK